MPKPARARCPSRASFTSSRTIFARCLRRSITGSRRERSAPAQRLLRHRAERREDAAGNVVEVHCTYIRRAAAASRPTPQGQVDDALGIGRARHLRRNSSLRQTFLKARPYDLEEGQDVLDNLNPNSLEIVSGAKLEPLSATPSQATASSSSASATSASIRTR